MLFEMKRTHLAHNDEPLERGSQRRVPQAMLPEYSIGNISRIEGTANKATSVSANHEIPEDMPSKEPPAKRFHRSHVERFYIYISASFAKWKNLNVERERGQGKL